MGTTEQFATLLERFSGDKDAILDQMAMHGLEVVSSGTIREYQELIAVATDVKSDDDINDQTAEPKEWIERQDQERRAWAIGSATKTLKYADQWDQNALIALAKEIENYVKGTNPDLNDVAAQDEFYITVGAWVEERFSEGVVTDEYLQDSLVDLVDLLAKQGVRLKDGVKA